MKKNNLKSAEFIFDVVSLNKKGQILIPSKVRKKLSLKEGDKLLVVVGEKGALILMKAKDFVDRFKEFQQLSEKIKLI